MSVTVYILNKNYSNFLSRAIESVVSQSHKDLEIFIIDDCSTDDSREIIDKYKNNDKIKCIFNKKSIGLIKSANLALNLSNKDYILRLDADDYLYQNAIKNLYRDAIKDKSIGLVYGNYNLIDSQDNILRRRIRLSLNTEVKLIGHPCHGACTLFNVQALKDIGGYSEKFKKQDGVFAFFSILIKGWKISNIKTIIFGYTQHQKSLSANKRSLYKTRSEVLSYIGESNRETINSIVLISISDLDDLILLFKGKINFFNYLNNELNYYINLKFIKKIVVIANNKSKLEKLIKNDKLIIFEVLQEFDKLNFNNNLLSKIKYVLKNLKLSDRDIYFLRNLEYPNLGYYYLETSYNILRLLKQFQTILTIKRIDDHLLSREKGSLRFIQDDLLEMHEREEKYINNGGLIAMRNNVIFNNKKDSLYKEPIYGLEVDEISSIHVSSPIQEYLFNKNEKNNEK